jgi:ABC-type Zn uptake system ZnuABC Zn-binding protein ZnuA
VSDRRHGQQVVRATIAGLVLGCWGVGAAVAGPPPLRVAVAVRDIETIVKDVGGGEVETFTLFTGCLLRRNLEVEASVQQRLLVADAVVWTGYQPEALAVRLAVSNSNDSEMRNSWCPQWINVSRGATQVDAPVSSMAASCVGYVDVIISHGDPFFWLNPENGAVIANEVAKGLTKLRPTEKAGFAARASAFGAALRRSVVRWKEQLQSLANLTVFSTQCGWQNFARLGGPTFVVCKQVRGCVLAPQALVVYARQKKVNVVLLDSHTPAPVAQAFREAGGWRAFELPSSIEGISGAGSYADLFDAMIRTLKEAAATPI